MTTLHLNVDNCVTKKQNLRTAVYTNATVGICLLVVLTTLVGISNTNPDWLNYAITEFKFLNSPVQREHVSHGTLSQIQTTWPRGKPPPPQWIVNSGCCDNGDQRHPPLLPALEAHSGGGRAAAQ